MFYGGSPKYTMSHHEAVAVLRIASAGKYAQTNEFQRKRVQTISSEYREQIKYPLVKANK
jgi:hypothetical protein